MPLTIGRETATPETAPLGGSVTTLLLRGLLAGLIAGLLAGAVAYLLGEPHINAAIALEEAASAHEHAGSAAAAHSHGDDALVSRAGQQAGLFLATGLAGMALGAILASVLHYARRYSALPGSTLALAAAGLGWLAVEAVPFAKYPANPPAVGDPETIAQRTWLWLAAVVVGLVAIAAAVAVARYLRPRTRGVVRLAAPTAAFLVVAGLGVALLPEINEVGADFPASLLWEFRVSSLATQATLWLVLGFAFALLTERAQPTTRRRPAQS